MPQNQARIQADAFRDFSAVQEEKTQKELATRGDLRETELRPQKEMREIEMRLLKWQLGASAALAAILTRGFGWLGF